jgi:Ferritin-like domain/TAT (twin-arginine translocation) pathway signal sequence
VVGPGSPVSRRQLLGASGAAGVAAALSACGRSPGPSVHVSTLPSTLKAVDATIVNGLIDAEYFAAAAYIAGIPLLSDHNLRAAKHFLVQEVAHVLELSNIVTAAQGAPHGPHASYDLGHPRSGTQVLELIHRAEQGTIRAYLDAIPKLSPGAARAAAASILANEAQHISVIRRTLGLDPVPSAVVTSAE